MLRWDDYERFTVCVTGATTSGIGLKTIGTFHTHGTPPADAAGPAGARG